MGGPHGLSRHAIRRTKMAHVRLDYMWSTAAPHHNTAAYTDHLLGGKHCGSKLFTQTRQRTFCCTNARGLVRLKNNAARTRPRIRSLKISPPRRKQAPPSRHYMVLAQQRITLGNKKGNKKYVHCCCGVFNFRLIHCVPSFQLPSIHAPYSTVMLPPGHPFFQQP